MWKSILGYNDEEIEVISEACKITAKVLDEIEGFIKSGISTYSIDSFAKNRMSTGTLQTTGSTSSLYYR